MSKRRLFSANDSNPNISMVESQRLTPNRGGIHPALIKTPTPGYKRNSKPTSDMHPAEVAKKSKPNSETIDQDSDSDPLEVPGFFPRSPQKLPYSKEEDEIILKYVLKGENIFKVSSILLWKYLESKKENPKRTYQSLKNRFLRNIKPCLFTRFGHLIKDKATTEKILSKFPELKQSVGRREVLPNIKLPERKPPKKATEEDGVSSTSAYDFQESEDRVLASASPQSDNLVIDDDQNKVDSDSLKSVVYERVIKATGSDIIVSVDFTSKKYVETPALGIYEMFNKLKRKNKFAFCPTCGRYNNPKRETSVIPNSQDQSSETSSKSSKKLTSRSKLNKNTSKQTRTSSEPYSPSPCSPSLLNDNGETRGIDKSSPQKSGENIKRPTRSSKRDVTGSGDEVSQISSSITPAEKEGSIKSRNEVLRMAVANSRSSKEANSTNSSSPKKGHSGLSKRQRDSDEDVESICEDTMTNFRKLIDFEEEQLLVKKCLNRNYKTMGLEELSRANWDSYFLESSSDVDTPPLTIDCEMDTQNNTGQSGATKHTEQNTSDSSVSKNSKKTSRKKKKS